MCKVVCVYASLWRQIQGGVWDGWVEGGVEAVGIWR